jgi:hypothetical protein
MSRGFPGRGAPAVEKSRVVIDDQGTTFWMQTMRVALTPLAFVDNSFAALAVVIGEGVYVESEELLLELPQGAADDKVGARGHRDSR